MTQAATAPAGKYAPPNGKPAKSVPYHKDKRYGDAELKELKEALDSGTLFYASGTKVKTLEKQFAAKHECRHGIACSSSKTARKRTAQPTAGSPSARSVTSVASATTSSNTSPVATAA